MSRKMAGSTGYYARPEAQFVLFQSTAVPAWRAPQSGALGALLKHWSLANPIPALLSLPTGTGKSAVELATAYLCSARRVLVVVPSVELRRQLASVFRTEDVLLRIGSLAHHGIPKVMEVEGRVGNWTDLEDADVVVALPNSISPSHYEDHLPPSDLFDLIVIDEAHHAPAPTWRSILEYFQNIRAVLLTATPRRRDGQRLPGEHIYHYPLRQALVDRIFKPVQAQIVDVPRPGDRRSADEAIADEVVRVLASVEHASSTALIRCASRSRAADLANLYASRGLDIQVLHSGLGQAAQQRIITGLRSGSHRAVAVVGMLIEGFDLPSLRVLAYHDKHKSLPITAQLVGRLARVDDRFPQPSVLITARDADVFPELKGVVRALHEEDADWATIMPGIIDDEIEAHIADRSFAARFEPSTPIITVEALTPGRRAIILEVSPGLDWQPPFLDGEIPIALETGRVFRGLTIIYSALSPDNSTLLLTTELIVRPPWHNAPGLDTPVYDLHLVSFRRSRDRSLPSLLLFNTPYAGLIRELVRTFDGGEVSRAADPARLQRAFDSLNRLSVSSVGVRNTYPNFGIPSYRSLAGSGLDRGIRDADIAFAALGHAMVQVGDTDGAFTAGISTAKGKYWDTRYVTLREYEEFVTDMAERYWYPAPTTAGQLLPQITHPRRLEMWPSAEPLAVELDSELLNAGWQVEGIGALDDLDFRAATAGSGGRKDTLPLEAVAIRADGAPVVWRGEQETDGEVNSLGADLSVRQGYALPVDLTAVLSAHPPTVFFVDGTTVYGNSLFDSRSRGRGLPFPLTDRDWAGVDLTAETRSTAAAHNKGRSVHEALEDFLRAQPRKGERRWILCNDGSGEIADYIVLETGQQSAVNLSLWHAKFAHGPSPAVRITDLQEVIAQAIKSRRWITDVDLWRELGDRFAGRKTPKITIVEGDEPELRAICGLDDGPAETSFVHLKPIVTGEIAIAQPGLSRSALVEQLAAAAPSQAAIQAHELLTVFHDAASLVATVTALCSR